MEPHMVRTSALPFSEFCGKAPALMEAYGAGRSAAQSTAWHALCADPGSSETRVKVARLTAEERDEIETWATPHDLEIDGHTLRYSDASKEATTILRHDGSGHVVPPPASSALFDDALTVGHTDFFWIVDGWAYVADLKRSTYTVSDGPASLQLHGYGFAVALAHNCRGYTPLIWAGQEAKWLPGERMELGGFAAAEVWARIEHAATNTGEAAPGAHCMGCYGAPHCPEHLLPAMYAAENLQAFMEGGPPMTDEAAVAGLQLAAAMETVAKLLKEQGKIYAAQKRGGALRDPVSGKKYLRVLMAGKQSGMSVADIQAKFGTEAHKYIKQGRDYERWSWVNDKTG
jgi:hypothetical protein